MDRYLAPLANKGSPDMTMAAPSHKRQADTELSDGRADVAVKKPKTVSDDHDSLPHFPDHSSAWQPAAQSFFDSLPPSHRSPFVGLLSRILDSTSLLASSSRALPSALAAPSPPATTSSPAASFDPSTALLSFLDLSFVQPRGRFDVHLTGHALVLSSAGKQPSNAFVPYASLAQLVAVPDVNRKDRCILLSLRSTAPPLLAGNGKTALHQLLLKVDTARKTSDAKALRVHHPSAQPQPPTTPTTIADYLLAALRQHCPQPLPLIIPQPDTFKSATATASVSCYHGTSDGQLYPLPAGLLFVQRPVLWLALDAVDGVEVVRSGGGKTFDLRVGVVREVGAGGGKEEVVVFGMISVMEQQAVEWYVQYVGKWQKRREKAQASASLNDGTAALKRAAASDEKPTEQRPRTGAADEQPKDSENVDDSDSEADSDFNPDDDGSASEGGDDGSGGGRRGGSDGSGSGSDSDDSQFDSDIDVEAEVSCAEEDTVSSERRRTRAAPSSQPSHSQPQQPRQQQLEHTRRLALSRDAETESESASEGEGAEESESAEERQANEPARSEGQVRNEAGDMSRFRVVVAAADTSKTERRSSASADDDDVITLD